MSLRSTVFDSCLIGKFEMMYTFQDDSPGNAGQAVINYSYQRVKHVQLDRYLLV